MEEFIVDDCASIRDEQNRKKSFKQALAEFKLSAGDQYRIDRLVRNLKREGQSASHKAV